MKIIFVSQPLSTGGSERVVASLANKFNDLGHEITVIVVDNGDQNVYPTNSNINFFHIKKYKKPLFDLLFRVIKIRRYLKISNPDVVIPFTTQKNVSTLLATIFTKHKVIISERNNPYLDPKNKSLRFLRKILYFKSDGIVFQTDEAKEFFSKKIQDRSCIIFNPINEDLPLPYKGERAKRIVMVNRLEKEKNIYMAIEAMKLVVSEYPEYILDIYGKGQLKDEIQNYINRNGLQKNIFLKGFSNEVYNEIKNASIFLLTSNYEGMSNSLIESMGLGLACISTDHPIGGARILIESYKNGILIPTNDVLTCATTINELIGNRILREKISINAINVRNTLSIKSISDKWLNYIDEVIGERNNDNQKTN